MSTRLSPVIAAFVTDLGEYRFREKPRYERGLSSFRDLNDCGSVGSAAKQFAARGLVPQRKGPAEAGPGKQGIVRGARHATSPTRSPSRASTSVWGRRQVALRYSSLGHDAPGCPTSPQPSSALCPPPPAAATNVAGRGGHAIHVLRDLCLKIKRRAADVCVRYGRTVWPHSSPAFHFASGKISGASLPWWVQGSTVQS